MKHTRHDLPQHSSHNPADFVRFNSNPRELLHLAIDLLKRNRITAPMVDDLCADRVSSYRELQTPSEGASHVLQDHQEGDLLTVVFLETPGESVLLYATIELLDLSSQTSVQIRLIDAGHLTAADASNVKDVLWVDEYSLADVGTITITSNHPISADFFAQIGWHKDPAIHKLAHLMVGLQNWAFEGPPTVTSSSRQ